MACQVILEFRIKDGCHDELKAQFRQFLPDTRAFDGCISIYLVQDQTDPAQMLIIEMWDSKDKYEKYLEWRGEQGDMALLETMWESPSWRFLDFWGV